jgi:hypothetical protein
MSFGLIISLSLLVVMPTTGGYELPDWPLDQEVLSQIESLDADSRMTAEEYAEAATKSELRRVLSADLVVLGSVLSVEPYERGTEIYTGITVDVEDCLKGHTDESTVTVSFFGGTIGDRILTVQGSGPPWSGPFTNYPPVEGDRYVFLAQWRGEDSDFLSGGSPRHRYWIVDGQVIRKGMPEDEFLHVLKAYLAPDVEEQSTSDGAPPN